MNESPAELMTRFPIFQGFTVDGASMLLERGAVLERKPGEVLFHEGDPAEKVHLVLSGLLEVFVVRGGKDLVLTESAPGSILGELAVLCGMPRSASVRAKEPALVLEWGATEFRRILLGNAFLSQRILGQSLRTLVEKERSLIDALMAREGVGGEGR